MIKDKKIKFPSELRFDLISKDWVVIATGRSKRPGMFKKEVRQKLRHLGGQESTCPFCRLKIKDVLVIPNKYPAFLPHSHLNEKIEGGLYQTINAVGFHEVVLTRDHRKSLGQFKLKEVKEVLDAYQTRYLALMNKKFVNYISIFHNHGQEAGASLSHPHSQIITTPLIDVDLDRALTNSKNYYQKRGKCVYCQMNEWEKKVGKRIIFENEDFLATCPFASKSAFEIIISPKNHLSYFERASDKEKWQLAEAFQAALSKIYKGLGDPPYNFYLHTAPCDGKDYSYYHWHWTILPKTSTWAGFELGVRMEISTIEPEKAAGYLRSQ